MRLIRLGAESSEVGADVRAALASWGRGEGVVGGVALLGCRPADTGPVDAIMLLPRGLLVVVGVDLPDPAVKLEAPLTAQWKTDGWPLTRPDGAVNPATEVLAVVEKVTEHLQHAHLEPLPIATVIAVGPYVSTVEQPTADLQRGIRVLHPEPMTLLTAARELATHPRPCTVAQARAVLDALEPDNTTLADLDLGTEGFPETAEPDLSALSTLVIPRITPPKTDRPTRPAGGSGGGSQLRWLPVGAAILVAMLLLTGIVFAVASAGDADSTDAPDKDTKQSGAVEAGGVSFVPKGNSTDSDCAEHAYGDVQVYLQKNHCDELVRMRFESTSDGKTAAVLMSVLRFQQSASATELNQVADKPGSGAIVDAASEGKPWPGDHKPSFESAAYASGREGNSLKLVQVVWIGAPSSPDDAKLVKLANAALDLTAP